MNTRLKELRKQLELSQQEFADKIALSRSYLANIEIGNQEVNDRTLKLICQEFNVSEKWLRTGEGKMFNTESDFITLVAQKLDDMDDFDIKIISEYLKLSKQQRKPVKDFIKKLI
jgi:transcriptional regulator with XRE-family HTH domain